MLNEFESYTCDVCGSTDGGYDVDVHDLDMEKCECGHVFCERHRIDYEQTVDDIKSYLRRNFGQIYDEDEKKLAKRFLDTEGMEVMEDFGDDYLELDEILERLEYEVGTDMHCCPICMLKHINHEDGFLYLLKKLNMTENDLLKEIREKFKSELEFEKYVNANAMEHVSE